MANTVPVLDLTPVQLDIRFQKGSSFNPVFYYLAPDNSVIDLSGYTAKMQARSAYGAESVLTGWDLTTGNGGLSIVQGTAELEDGTTVAGAWGVQANVLPAVTAAVTWATAYYDCDLINGSQNIPLVKGRLYSTAEITP